MFTFRQIAKTLGVLIVLLAVAFMWWRWPEDTMSGLWAGVANGETIRVAFVQEPTGKLRGHGIVVINSTGAASAAGEVEGTRVDDRIVMTLSAEKQVLLSLLVQMNARGQLVGEYFKPAAKGLPITLTRQ